MSNETCMSVHGDLLAGLALEPEKKKKKKNTSAIQMLGEREKPDPSAQFELFVPPSRVEFAIRNPC